MSQIWPRRTASPSRASPIQQVRTVSSLPDRPQLTVHPTDPGGVPIVKGVTTVPNATTDQVYGAIIPTGQRKLWDPRLESAGLLQRYAASQSPAPAALTSPARSFDPSAIEFYTVMKGQMFISARDFVGVQLVERSHAPNQPIAITQTSVVDDERAPAQGGRVRAKAHFGGWLIECVGACACGCAR